MNFQWFFHICPELIFFLNNESNMCFLQHVEIWMGDGVSLSSTWFGESTAAAQEEE